MGAAPIVEKPLNLASRLLMFLEQNGFIYIKWQCQLTCSFKKAKQHYCALVALMIEIRQQHR